jgi:tetratricopeptide (TPR) repeat protein
MPVDGHDRPATLATPLTTSAGASSRARSASVAVRAVSALLLAAVVWGVYRQVGTHDYVNLDDDVYVVDNLHVRSGLTLDNVAWAFGGAHEAYWLPLTWLSLMTDCQLFGLDAGAHLIENVALHTIDALLLFTVLVWLTARTWPSLWVAAMFALHPTHVEAVAWVSQRKDVLSALAWMVSLAAYAGWVRRPGGIRYAALMAAFTLGLLAKPMVVTLPLVLLLLDYWPLARCDLSLRRRVLEKLPLFVLSLAGAAVTLATQRSAGAVPALSSIPVGERIANALGGYLLYLGKLVWPANLAVFYPLQPVDPSLAAAAAVLLAIVTATAWTLRGRAPYLLVGWAWFLVTLLPVIGLVQVGGQSIADRYTYLPSIGLFIAVAWGAADLLAVTRLRLSLLATAAVATTAVCALLSWQQLHYWRDSIALFEHTLAVTRDNFLAQNNLGEALARAGRSDEAMQHYSEAVRIHPGYAPARNNLGISLAERGRYAEADANFEAALAVTPDSPTTLSNLATSKARQGQYAAAIGYYRRALELDPTSEVAHESLADTLVLSGKIGEAIAHYRESIRLDPSAGKARASLARVLEGRGTSPGR